MGGFLEHINEWGYALGKTLEPLLETGSISAVFVVLAAGLLTSLTPCVYPMIPVTVTYIGGASEGSRRRAVTLSLIYGGGLAVVYGMLGVIAAKLGETFGQFTRNPWVYGTVAVVIILLGIAMLDLITIPVPGFAAKVQSKGASRGGYLGALMMGSAAGLVAAPCAAPVLIVLLVYVAKSGDVLWGGALLLVFGIGLSTLLMLLGMFSGLLTSLPGAGPWMVRIKKAFGVLMLLIGAYYVYVAATM